MPRPRTLLQSVASSVDAPPSLLPVLPDLFAGCDSLGSSPRQVVSLLRAAGIGSRHRVLDIACGKGAAAIAVARRLGCRVTGIDGYPPFIEAARAAAAKSGVEHLCTFFVGDVNRFRPRIPRHRFDAALMLGLYGADRAPAILRCAVKPRGVYVLDDAFRVASENHAARGPRLGDLYDDVPLLDDARAHLTRRGDRILRQVVASRRAISKLNARLYKAIAANSRRLMQQHPALAADLRDFLARQREANRVLLGPLRPALWLVKRA